MVKNTPANVRDMGSIPGPGRSHMPLQKEAEAPQPLRPPSGTRVLQQGKQATGMGSLCTTIKSCS